MKLINYVTANYNQIGIKLLVEEQAPETVRSAHGMIYFRAM